jgi:cytochrome c553
MNLSRIVAHVGAVVMIATLAAAEQSKPVASAPAVPLWAFPPSSIPTFSTKTEKNETLPGSTLKFSEAQLRDRTVAVDWFPQQHPVMPPAVKGGRGTVFACGYCHLPDGLGRPENAILAGMPFEYLRQQMRDMKSGKRGLIDSHFIPNNNMLITVRQTSDADSDAAVKYFSGLRYSKHVKVVETASIPKASGNGFVYVFDKSGAREPLGERIIEGPDDFEQFEKRDNRTRFTAYVPVGSIARGAALAKGDGATRPACAICHGVGFKGGPLGPPIAGHFPSGIFRQLYAIQIGTRNGVQAALMKPNVIGLTQRDMIDLAAYVGSLP